MNLKIFLGYAVVVLPVVSTLASLLSTIVTQPLKPLLFYYRSDDRKSEAETNADLWLKRGNNRYVFLLSWNQFLWHFLHTFIQSNLCILLSYMIFKYLGLLFNIWVILIFILWDIFFMINQNQSWKQFISSVSGYITMYSFLLYWMYYRQ
jgi:hypothetical protein